MPKDRYRLYHLEKARGGVGLTMIGGSAVVSPDSPPAFGNMLLYRDEIVPWLARLTEDVHEAGAAVMCQVTHLGRRTSNFTGDWLPLVYPSGLREAQHRSFPKVAEAWDVDRIVGHFADAAARCRAAGLDGIEIQSYGHLFDAWASPVTNDRDDAFGGDEERRLEFPLRVLRAVRAAVGPDFVVGLRMSMDEDLPGGLGVEQTLAVLRRYQEVGIDFLSVIKGGIDTDARLAATIPSMGTPSAPHLELAGEIRRATGIPVMHAARIGDVATARHAVRDGLLDLVGMTRPQIADPHLVAKVARGEEDRVRPCVGASYCLDAIYESGDAKCIHNPATGREAYLPQVVSPTIGLRLLAVVVGAGSPGSRRPGCWVSAATTWCSWRRPTGRAARCCWRRRRGVAATSSASSTGGSPRPSTTGSSSASGSTPRWTTCSPTSPTSSWSPPVGCPTAPSWPPASPWCSTPGT